MTAPVRFSAIKRASGWALSPQNSSALRLDKRKQIRVDLVLEGGAHAVRCSLVYFERGTFDEFGREHCRVGDRHDLVVVAMQDERRYVNLFKILGLIRLRNCLDAEIAGRETGHN